MRLRIVLVLIMATLVAAAGVAGCSSPPEPIETPMPAETPEPAEAPTTPTVTPSSVPRDAADDVLQALQSKDGAALAALVHPSKGVRFSPYAYVDVSTDVTLTREEVSTLWTDITVRTWGAEDGSGFPIEMTGSDYVDRFVLDKDYSKASSISTNEDRAFGNTINNVVEAYPGATRVEYYVEGAEGSGEPGFDWGALRLVFETVDGRYYLVGIIHDEWTI